MAFEPKNSDLVLANDLNLWIVTGTGNTRVVVGYATSASLEVSSDEIDASNKMSPRWKMAIQGGASYTVSADALYTKNKGVISFDYLLAKMVSQNKADAVVHWVMGTSLSTDITALDETAGYYEGDAVINSLSITGGNNEVASCSISLTGSGALVTHEATA